MRRNKIQIGTLLDIGDVKKSNQDKLYYNCVPSRNGQAGLFVIADGMGGLAFGEEVSNLVTLYFNHWWEEFFYPWLNSPSFEADQVENMLEEAIIEINRQALDFSRSLGQKAGSTLSLLLLVGRRYWIKNIGDSRVYILRKQKMTQLTEDQSLVAQMVRNGEITAEEAKNHPKRNILLMCLGVFEEIKSFSGGGKVQSGDIFLLCSDGFHNYVPEKYIMPVIKDRKCPDWDEKAIRLRRTIAPGDAKDNISVIMLEWLAPVQIKKIFGLLLILGGLALLGFAAGYYGGENAYGKYVLKLLESIWK